MDDITTPDASSSSSEAGKRKRRYSESDGAAKKRQKRIDETPDERAIRLEKDRIRKRLRRNSESELEREKRLEGLRQNQKRTISEESSAERDARLLNLRSRKVTRIAEESNEQKEARLLNVRSRQATRIAEESNEQREARLLNVRSRQATRIAEESNEQREARLRILSFNQSQRMAKESSEQRTKRLCDLSFRQKKRLAEESFELRISRLDTYRKRRRLSSPSPSPSPSPSTPLSPIGSSARRHVNLGRMSEVWDFNEAEVPLEFQRQFEGIFRSTEGMCEHCGAYKWKRERKGLCCLNGTVKLPQLPPPPDELLPLYTASGSHFLKHARAYNNLFALASLGCSEIRQPGFNPTFTVQGKMYHRIGSLLPAEGESAKFAQLYFHDTENAVSNRMNVVSGLQEHNIQLIDRVLREVNPYITSLKAGIELMEASPEVRLVLHADKNRRPTGEHARRYNLPTASEVGAILPGEVTANLDVILHPREGPLRRISPVHRSYDPLHYVMLFPYGNDGFQLGLRKTNNRKNHGGHSIH
ncbi:hypothetical protein ACHWQZ_G007688 [Mnemiopsis leidyi]